MIPQHCLQRAQETSGIRTVDAFAFGAVCEMSLKAFFANLPRIRIHAHMIWANQLRIMGPLERDWEEILVHPLEEAFLELF